MLSDWTGSFPFRKTSLTRFGHSAVGNIPEGSQTLMTDTSGGRVQPSGGTFCEAICINAFHKTAGMRGDTSLCLPCRGDERGVERAPVHTVTTRAGE